MPKLLAALLFAVVLRAQTPAPEVKDPLGRTTPQQSIFNFLEACHARDYAKATYYLDLGRMPAGERATAGPGLAMQLEDLLDDSTFDIATLSRDPEGDLSDLSPNIDKLASFEVNGQQIVLQLAASGAASRKPHLGGFGIQCCPDPTCPPSRGGDALREEVATGAGDF